MAQLTLKETIPSPLVLRDKLEEMAVKELQGPAQGDEEVVADGLHDKRKGKASLCSISRTKARADDGNMPFAEALLARPC